MIIEVILRNKTRRNEKKEEAKENQGIRMK
jgi:hypothetical protein